MTDESTKTSLAMFDPLKAELAVWREENEKLNFDYQTAKGETLARKHVYRLKRTKGKIVEVHKDAKREALAHCQAVDAEKNWCLGEVEKMIKVHMDPIDAKVKRQKDAEEAAAEKLRLEKEAEEAARLKEIEEREAKVKADEERLAKKETERQAKIKAEEKEIADRLAAREVEMAKVESERQAKVEAEATERQIINKRIQDGIDAKHRAEIEKLAKIAEVNEVLRKSEERKQRVKEDELAAERAKFEAEKRAEANARQRVKDAAEARGLVIKQEKQAEAAVKKSEEEAETKRVANEKHRYEIETDIHHELLKIVGPNGYADELLNALKFGKIPHIQIIY